MANLALFQTQKIPNLRRILFAHRLCSRCQSLCKSFWKDLYRTLNMVLLAGESRCWLKTSEWWVFSGKRVKQSKTFTPWNNNNNNEASQPKPWQEVLKGQQETNQSFLCTGSCACKKWRDCTDYTSSCPHIEHTWSVWAFWKEIPLQEDFDKFLNYPLEGLVLQTSLWQTNRQGFSKSESRCIIHDTTMLPILMANSE